jgi:hypothetical protein
VDTLGLWDAVVPREEFTTDRVDCDTTGRREYTRRGEGTAGSGAVEAPGEDQAALSGGVPTSSGAADGAGEHPGGADGPRTGVSPDPPRAWARQRAIDTGQRDGLTTDERQEPGQPRREVRRLQGGRGILEEAAAFFAAEGATR